MSTEMTSSVQRLSRDLAKAGATLSDTEARFLVDKKVYPFIFQLNRKRGSDG